jgi:hypothetical protein
MGFPMFLLLMIVMVGKSDLDMDTCPGCKMKMLGKSENDNTITMMPPVTNLVMLLLLLVSTEDLEIKIFYKCSEDAGPTDEDVIESHGHHVEDNEVGLADMNGDFLPAVDDGHTKMKNCHGGIEILKPDFRGVIDGKNNKTNVTLGEDLMGLAVGNRLNQKDGQEMIQDGQDMIQDGQEMI